MLIQLFSSISVNSSRSSRPPSVSVDHGWHPRKAVHLGEGKPLFQTSAALRPYPAMEKASEVNLEEKSGAGVPKAVRRCIQPVLTAPATALVPNCSDPVGE